MVKIGGVVVVAAWLVMMAVLAQKGMPPGKVSGAGGSLRTGEQWMGIYLEGGKVGYAVTRVDEDDGGYRVHDEMLTVLTMQGFRQEVRTVINSRVDGSLVLKGFDFSLKSGLADMTIKGEVAGSVMKLDVNTAGRVQEVEVPLTGKPHLASDLELYLRGEGLEVGKKFHLPFFDPASLSQQYIDIHVEAREDLKLGDRLVPVYRLRQEYSGMSLTSWLNPELGTVKGEGPMGFTFLMETKEQAMSEPDGGYRAADIIALASVQAKGGVPEPRKASFLKARLYGADLSGMDLSGGRQTYSDGVVTVTVEDTASLGNASLPVTEQSLMEYLKPTTFIQSDDPKIKQKAGEIIGGEMDALRAARKLADWVNRSVEKRPTAGIPSAVEVLGNLEGDCNEHTVLYTALARAAGLPARMDAGIVMFDGRFYYHAWPEVYAGGWVSLDPTFGQFPADATHIKFVEGELDKQVAIAKLFGKLHIDILEHR